MRSSSSRNGALRKRERGNCGRQLQAFAGRHALFSCRWNKINASALDGTLFALRCYKRRCNAVVSRPSWRRNKINASSRNGTLFVATNVDAKTMQRNALRCSVNSRTFRGAGTSVARVRWMANRYSASSQDGALRKHEPGWGGRQRNALLQHDFVHFSWPWNKRSASSLDGALRKRDRGWTAVFFFFFFLRFAGAFCACALPILKEGPLGTISVRFNTCRYTCRQLSTYWMIRR